MTTHPDRPAALVASPSPAPAPQPAQVDPVPDALAAATTPARHGRALLALAMGAFGLGTTEFLMMGLLPQVAAGLGVSVSAVGYVISAYALGVVVGAPTLSALSVRFPRQRVIVGLMLLFAVGHLATAFAPGYEALLGARFLTGLAHGSFFGVAAVVARSVAAPGRSTQAISMVVAGLTVAQVVGVPGGTALGQLLGWRWAFGLVALLGLATAASVLAWVPLQRERPDRLRTELAALGRPQVLLTLAVTAVGTGGLFAVYSYVAPILTELAGFSASAVVWVLVVYGVGTTAGTLLGGRLGDRFPERSVVGGLAGLGVACLVLVFTSGSPVPAVATLVLFGLVSFFIGPPLINRVIAVAPGSGLMASAANQAAFNAANALGAALGALVLAAGYGLHATMLVGAGLAFAGVGIALVAVLLKRAEE